ncbi:restriction endonuclease subunit S [Streptococcus sanguinis]|uniref:Restriction endonuclease subunit S n=1 Tax=Streptococcus sanguinis TaxID=1305 RepID=A0A7H8V6R5_STRSA|nr:restriction endonuclease subunit S [Streptococcus sanguinis]
MTEERKAPAIRFKEFSGQNAEAWEQRKLEEVVEVNSGKDYKHLSTGTIPVYGTGGYMLSVSESLSDVDGIGIGRKGTIDKPYILKAPFWTVDTLFYCIPKDANNLYFVYSVFNNVTWKNLDESTGVPSLSKITINNIQSFFPTPPEQRVIGSFFQELDQLITLQQRKLEKSRRIKKAMLQKMFPGNKQTVPAIRFKEFSGVAWKKWKLEEVADRFDNLRIPVSANKRKSGSIPYYGANGIQDYVDGYTHDGEYVLIAEDGANDLKDYPIQYVNGKVWVNNHAHVVQGRSKMVDTKFLAFAMKQINFKPYLVGGGRAKLNADIMMKLPLKLPTPPEQRAIGSFFQDLDKFITLQQCRLDKLQNMKKALLEQMMM